MSQLKNAKTWLAKQKIPAIIFLVIFTTYIATSFDVCTYPSQPEASDKGFIFGTTWVEHLHTHECYAIYYQTGALLEGRTYLTVNNPPDLTRDCVLIGDKYYALGEPVPAAMLLPFYAIGSVIDSNYVIRSLMIGMIIFTCISALLVRKIALQLKQTELTATLAALLFGFTTMAFSYSRLLYPQPIVTLLMLASIVFLLSYKENKKTTTLFLLALFYALTVFSFNVFVITAPFFLYYLYKTGVPIKPKTLYTITLAILPVILLFLAFNVATTGNPLVTTRMIVHHSMLFQTIYPTEAGTWVNMEGIVGQLFSPVGIFFVSPILLVSLYTFNDFKTKVRQETLLFAAIIILYWLFMSWGNLGGSIKTDFWVGGWANIARYMYVPSALLVIFAAASVQKVKDNHNLIGAWVISLFIGVSFLANLSYEIRRDLMVGFLKDFPSMNLLLWPQTLGSTQIQILISMLMLGSLIFPAYLFMDKRGLLKKPSI